MRCFLRPSLAFSLVILSLLAFISCGPTRPARKDRIPSPDQGPETAELSMLFAPSTSLEGEPNAFSISLKSTSSDAKLERAGDLPRHGQLLTLSDLPALGTTELSASLYKDELSLAAKTHVCHADSPLHLIAGETASATLSCLPLANTAASQPVQVFLKLARLSLTINEASAQTFTASRDLALPMQFAGIDTEGQRISLIQDTAGLRVFVGGQFSYIARRSADPASEIQKLIEGETLTLTLAGGSLAAQAPPTLSLTLSGPVLLTEDGSDTLRFLLPLQLASTDGSIHLEGQLTEELPASEFTIASYNVENLFDQLDAQRNAGYGDYRVGSPNEQGCFSNYGDTIDFDGHLLSFTAIKITGIRKTLLGMDPLGPAIVALQEIESAEALDELLAAVRDLGYREAIFKGKAADGRETAVGVGLLSKFDVLEASSLHPASDPKDNEAPRPILKARLDVFGRPMTIYVNHWKSKGGPESLRKRSAEALQADIDALLATNPAADYLIAGDLNSDYNENVIIEAQHNDSNGTTGINTVLKAQGDELKVAKARDLSTKYNLHYELDRSARRSAWHEGFGWSSMDHMIIGSGLYDQIGVTYIDNSFQIANPSLPDLRFLFKEDGTTKRWMSERQSGRCYTHHSVGGYSDHAPLFARFRINRVESPRPIWLVRPSRSDASD